MWRLCRERCGCLPFQERKKKLESGELICIKFGPLGLKKWWKRILTITEIWTSLLGVAEWLLSGPCGVMETDHSPRPPVEGTGGPPGGSTWCRSISTRVHWMAALQHLPLAWRRNLRLYWSWTALLDGVPSELPCVKPETVCECLLPADWTVFYPSLRSGSGLKN